MQELQYSVQTFDIGDGNTIADNMYMQFVNGQEILSDNVPTIWIRHYPFLDFSHFHYKWRPTYINIVREPIEKVITCVSSKVFSLEF